jgi:hypothetical protein
LSATLVAALPPTATPGPDGAPIFSGIEGVAVEPLDGAAGTPLWLVYSHGYPQFDTQKHFVALYTHAAEGWRELSRLELEHVDYLGAGGVSQAQVVPGQIWLEVQAGVGAHSGCYNLLRFDGVALRSEVAGCNSSPGAGALRDLDGDGLPEAILNQSDNYVFCYACGERYFSYAVYRWDGSVMQRVTLDPLPQAGAAPLNQALALARLGLWKDAQQTIAELEAAGALGPPYRLYAGMIELHAEDFAAQVSEAKYPLLDQLFYGNYPAALDALRAYPPEQLFAAPSPLISGTAAEGWDFSVTYWVTSTTTTLLDAPPTLALPDPQLPAAAHFLRGWALTLANPADPAALADIERAAQLAPNERLFADSAAYLRR